MRVLLLTRDAPNETLTGVAVYVRDLAAALVRQGREVVYLHLAASPRRVRSGARSETRNGIRAVATVVPGVARRAAESGVLPDVDAPALTRALVDAVDAVRPDIVHVHDLSGIPASVIPAIRAQGRPVVVTLHDFWPFCRQLLLVRPGLIPCAGSGGGTNCAQYCSSRTPLARGILQKTSTMMPVRLRPLVGRWVRLYRKAQGRSYSQFALPSAPHAASAPRQSDIRAYALREAQMRDALLAAGCLLAPSEFAKEQYVRHGYPAERIRVLPLSLLAFERTARRVRSFDGYPVNFGYLGRVNPWKGAHVLARAMRGIPAGLARVTLYGSVAAEDREYLTKLSGTHPNLHFGGSYGREDLPRILDGMDVAVFPSIMSETLGLVGAEAQAAGVPLIASNLGAIPEYVRHEINGLLFPAGDADALRQRMLRILQEPRLIAQLSVRAPAPSLMEDHVGAIALIYAALLDPSRHRNATTMREPLGQRP